MPDWAAQLIVWAVTVGIVLAPFSVKISHALANMMNRAAASSDLDDDEFLRKLYSHPAYRSIAFVLRFVSIDLPTLAMLERAITLQTEAVHEAKVASGTGPNV